MIVSTDAPVMADPPPPPSVIDIQTHYVGPEAAILLRRALAAGATIHGLGARLDPGDPMLDLDNRLRAMDDAGIQVSVLSLAPIGVLDDAALAAELCTAANDGLLEACRSHPNRFVMAAALPLPYAKASIIELRRIQAEDEVRAVQMVAQTLRYQPDAPEYQDLFACASAAHLPVVIHPAAGISDLSPAFDAFGLSSGMHAMVSHALVAARMIHSGMLDRIPGLELIMTHLGGVLPFLIDRLDSRATSAAAFLPSYYLRTRLWVDACGYPNGPALRCVIETMGAERVMVGSDWPSRPIAPALDAIRALGLGDAAAHAILGGNAARWFDPAQSRAS
jgi:predicted TIM-barrel fold metal-dependent hydrolase